MAHMEFPVELCSFHLFSKKMVEIHLNFHCDIFFKYRLQTKVLSPKTTLKYLCCCFFVECPWWSSHLCCVSLANRVSCFPSRNAFLSGTAGNAGLPDAEPGAEGAFGCGAKDAATHLRNIFYRSRGIPAGREVESVDD